MANNSSTALITKAAKRKSPWAFGWILKLTLAAAVLVLIIGSAGLWLRHWQREQALTELADLHVTTLASAKPVDVASSDRHTVKPWFAGKLPFTFNLPELQGSPYSLIGGRVAYFEHNPAAELLFVVENQGTHQMSVFVFEDHPSAMPFSAGITRESELAFNMETWSESGLRYVVISDADRAGVDGLAELLRRAAGS